MNAQQELAAQIMSQAAAKIVACLPAGAVFDRSRIVCGHFQDGTEIYSYDGVPFLEIQPMEFKTVQDGQSIKLVVSRNYRRLP